MFEYQTVQSFFAQGNYHFGQHSIPVQIIGEYKNFSPEAVQIKVWSDHQQAHNLFDSSMDLPFLAWFDGKTELGEDLWLMGIKPKEIIGFNQMEGDVNIFISGDINSIVKPNENIAIHAKLSSTSVIMPEWIFTQGYDGTITHDGDKERSGIAWENIHGHAKLIDNYEYVNGGIYDNHLSLRIRTNSLFLTISPKVDTEVKAILLDLQKYIFEDLTLLSFIGRKRVVCFEASARGVVYGKPQSAFARYNTWGGFYNLPSDQSFLRSIIHPKSLQRGIFADLVTHYRKSLYKGVVDRTIPYLLASYEDGYLETQLVNAYAALESMVAGIGSTLGQESLIGSQRFKRLSKAIAALIKQEVPEFEIADGMIKKIPELKRQSFTDRLLYLLSSQGVNTNLIWPPGTDEPIELHELIKRRNQLIHTGVVNPGNVCLFDLNRAQKLVELWILKLLECPDDAINQYSLWRGAPINKVLH